jgi:hypothetical protein
MHLSPLGNWFGAITSPYQGGALFIALYPQHKMTDAVASFFLCPNPHGRGAAGYTTGAIQRPPGSFFDMICKLPDFQFPRRVKPKRGKL